MKRLKMRIRGFTWCQQQDQRKVGGFYAVNVPKAAAADEEIEDED